MSTQGRALHTSADGGAWPRIILHVDMDAFYASIEQRDRPELRGQPVVVGGGGARGVVAAASYEARKFGVRSAMPGFEARRRCPNAVFLAPRMAHYAAESRRLRQILDRWSPLVEPLSLDEAFLDMSGSERLFGPPEEMASSLREEIRSTLGLTASVGVATVKFIAKIASDMRKPDGQLICPPGSEAAFLAPLPVEKLWGVGPRAAARLRDLGIRKVADVRECDPGVLRKALGSAQGDKLHRLAQGQDERSVIPLRRRKSLGAERTLRKDIAGRSEIRALLLPLLDEVARGLRAEGLQAGTLTLKLKTSAFRLVTRSRQLERPCATAPELLPALDSLLNALEVSGPFRLVGVSAHGLEAASPGGQQLVLDPCSMDGRPARTTRHERLASVMDKVTERFGSDLLTHASVHQVRASLRRATGVQAEEGERAGDRQSAQAGSTSPEMQSQSSD